MERAMLENISKLSVKFYLDEASSSKLRLADVVPVFHSWIQFHSIPNHQLIDVADYAHVPNGPGMLLVSHEANIYLDNFDQRLGLSYWRKQPLEGSFADRLRYVFQMALQCCAMLEENPALNGIKFIANLASFKINDRLFAPNTPETFAAVRPELERFAGELFGADAALENRGNPKQLFEVAIKTGSQGNISDLLARLDSATIVGKTF